jgi:SsrA-binding protein
MKTETIVNNKKSYFNYNIEDKYMCGLRIKGTEIKSIREGDCSIMESFCFIKDNEVFIKNMYIKKYKFGSHNNHDETRDRKLLLTKKEIKKIDKKMSEKGYSLVPLKLLIVDGWAKLEIGLGKGKKLFDKKNTIREKEEKIRIKRDFNTNI